MPVAAPILALARTGRVTALPGHPPVPPGPGEIVVLNEPPDTLLGPLLDPSTYGLRASSVLGAVSAGSMDYGSNTLTMTGLHGFQVGDPIAVEIGGEAGGGARGTHGVGGYGPASDPSNWYNALDTPYALITTVTAVSGATLTLADAAQETTTNANVYYDNSQAALFKTLLHERPEATPVSVRVPAGVYYTAQGFPVMQRANLDFAGAGKHATIFRGIKGGGYTQTRWYLSPGLYAHDYQVHSNGDPAGGYRGFYGAPGVTVSGSDNARVEHILFRDCTDAANFQYSTNAWGRRLISLAPASKEYFQWQFQIPDCWGGGFEDCACEADYLQAAFEPFKSTDATFRRMSGWNAVASNNKCENSMFDDMHLVFAAGAVDPEGYLTTTTPAAQSNLNVGGGPVCTTATYRDVVISRLGPASATGAYGAGLVVSGETWESVTVEQGLYWVPDAARLGTEEERYDRATFSIALEGAPSAAHSVTGFRSYSAHPAGYFPGGAVAFQGASQVGTMTDVVADSVHVRMGTETGTRTLAQWRLDTDRTAPPVSDFLVTPVRGPGAFDVCTYDVDGSNEAVHLAHSPWGYLTQVEFRLRDSNGVLLDTVRTRYGSFCLPAAGTYTVECEAWDEDRVSTVTVKTVVWDGGSTP